MSMRNTKRTAKRKKEKKKTSSEIGGAAFGTYDSDRETRRAFTFIILGIVDTEYLSTAASAPIEGGHGAELLRL